MSKVHALHSLYGGRVSRLREAAAAEGKALAGNVGGQKRNQTVLTPRWFVGQLIHSAGYPLGYDPCTTAWNPTKAKVFSTEKTDGLKTNWAAICKKHDGWIYVNPPFDKLKLWLAKCELEAMRGARIYCLAPFRPWRTWFCSYTEAWPVVSLAPFPFVGEKNAYPAPLCVISYNLPVPQIINPKGKNMVTGLWTVVTENRQELRIVKRKG